MSDTLKRERGEAKREKRRAKDKSLSGRQQTEPDAGAELVSPPEAQMEPTTDPALTGTETPQEMIARLYRAFAGQMDQLDARLKALLPDGAGDSSTGIADIDRTVKTLASLAKTLTVLLDMKEGGADDARESALDDPDELRADLAHRLERLCESGPH
ncbi:MAG: hypothetical protein ABJL55_17675 [Roseibium sp.]